MLKAHIHFNPLNSQFLLFEKVTVCIYIDIGFYGMLEQRIKQFAIYELLRIKQLVIYEL